MHWEAAPAELPVPLSIVRDAEKNPVTGEIHDPGYDCIMESWWNDRSDFEASQRLIASAERLPSVMEDEKNLFASRANPVCSAIEYKRREHPDRIEEWGLTPKGLSPQPTALYILHVPPLASRSARRFR